MLLKKTISRKKFIRFVLAFLLFPILVLLNGLVERSKKYGLSKRSKEIPAELGVGVNFFEEVIVVKEESGRVSMFSSKCPHLGCRINKYQDGKITCPCHGSTFQPDGSIVKGPASKSLTKLDYTRNKKGNFVVELNA